MSKTRDELIARVLKLLSVVGAGQTPEVEDYDAVDDEVESILADLSARNIANVSDPDEIDDDIFQAVALRVACGVAADFRASGIIGYPGMTIEDVSRFAEQRLRVINAAGPTYHVLRTEYY